MLQQKEQIPETVLVQRLREADEAAFRRVYEMYKSKLYWYCLKFVKSSEIVEEIVQDVFVKLWEHKEFLQPDTSLGAFLYTLAKHRVLNHIKKEALHTSYIKEKIFTTNTSGNPTESEVEYADYMEAANIAITRLPAQRQLIFKMSRQEEMSNQEIAVALGISKNTVKVQLVKALKTLRTSLGIKSKLNAFLVLVYSYIFL
jgi:RNA polymerase sigma-70 factor (family 1)